MPYDIVSVPNGYYVVGPSGRKSKKPLSMAMAKKQRTALNISKARPPTPLMSGSGSAVKTLNEGMRVRQVAEAARQAAELRDRMR